MTVLEGCESLLSAHRVGLDFALGAGLVVATTLVGGVLVLFGDAVGLILGGDVVGFLSRHGCGVGWLVGWRGVWLGPTVDEKKGKKHK